MYFNPRAPRGARRRSRAGIMPMTIFQSTCPARGTTQEQRLYAQHGRDFNPRAPRGARLVYLVLAVLHRAISIHVPREGHDHGFTLPLEDFTNFNPRAPRGARQQDKTCKSRPQQFQSTCPARGTTFFSSFIKFLHDGISIHVPREGHDPSKEPISFISLSFQSTCPARGTTLIYDTTENS